MDRPIALGSYHRGGSRFGSTAGMQCSCIALFALCWSKLRKGISRQFHDIDDIVNVGNDVYKMLAVSMYLTVDDQPAGIELMVIYLMHICEVL